MSLGWLLIVCEFHFELFLSLFSINESDFNIFIDLVLTSYVHAHSNYCIYYSYKTRWHSEQKAVFHFPLISTGCTYSWLEPRGTVLIFPVGPCARKLWHISQSLEMVSPFAVLCLSEWHRKHPSDSRCPIWSRYREASTFIYGNTFLAYSPCIASIALLMRSKFLSKASGC